MALGAVARLSGAAFAGSTVGGGGLGMLIAQRRMEKTEPAASIVLALNAQDLYLLGRHKIGPLASFDNLEVIHQIPRSSVSIDLSPAGFTQHLSITDEEDGTQ